MQRITCSNNQDKAVLRDRCNRTNKKVMELSDRSNWGKISENTCVVQGL